jgi:hypothetical protein
VPKENEMFQIVTKPAQKWRLIPSELENGSFWGTFHIKKYCTDLWKIEKQKVFKNTIIQYF